MPKFGQIWQPLFLQTEPLFQAFEPLASALRGPTFPDAAALTALVEAQRQARAPEEKPLRFAPMSPAPKRKKRGPIEVARLYDGSIELRSEVPTLNESYHDLLNALAFAAFPKAKRALHRRQYRALKERVHDGMSALPPTRSREQDALTIFDEGGVAIAMTPSAHANWLRTTARSPISACHPDSGIVPLLFGHALPEHLLEGQRFLRASGIILVVPQVTLGIALLDCVDRALYSRLTDDTEFQEPGADAIFEMNEAGQIWMGPPKPWNGWDRPPSERPGSKQLAHG